MHTGEIIKNLRKNRNMTQEELANLLGVQKSTVQKYESGKVQNLKLKTIQKLCGVFQITPFPLIFPNDWGKIQTPWEKQDSFIQYATLYFELTEAGRKKF